MIFKSNKTEMCFENLLYHVQTTRRVTYPNVARVTAFIRAHSAIERLRFQTRLVSGAGAWLFFSTGREFHSLQQTWRMTAVQCRINRRREPPRINNQYCSLNVIK